MKQKSLIEDRSFYRRVFTLAFPIIIQNSITNMVALLDNLMVGQLGTAPMSGVSIANQLLFVFNLIVFGATSGTGIFTAQFYGSSDDEGVRQTFRFKMILSIVMTGVCVAVFSVWSDGLVGMFLQGDGDAADAEQMLAYGKTYLKIMLIGLLPFAASSSYSSTLRECGETKVPMIASIMAVCTNLLLNYFLIFGHFGFPAMGVLGAAVATVISRFVELAIVAVWTHIHRGRFLFVVGVYRSLHISRSLLGQLAIRVSPLVLNETLWSVAVTMTNQSYTLCGLEVVNAINILGILDNLSNVGGIAVGNTIGIIMGQMLGARRKREEIMTQSKKLMHFSNLVAIVTALLIVLVARGFPMLYNTTDSIRSISTKLILVMALGKFFRFYCLSVYYTIRSGGRTWTTFFYDCGFQWLMSVPLAFILSRYTGLGIIPIYAICQIPEICKSFCGSRMLKNGSWIQNLTERKS